MEIYPWAPKNLTKRFCRTTKGGDKRVFLIIFHQKDDLLQVTRKHGGQMCNLEDCLKEQASGRHERGFVLCFACCVFSLFNFFCFVISVAFYLLVCSHFISGLFFFSFLLCCLFFLSILLLGFWVLFLWSTLPFRASSMADITHPPMDQLQDLEYCIDSNPPWRMCSLTVYSFCFHYL